MFVGIYLLIKKNANKYINYLFILLMFLIPFDKVVMNWIPPIIILLWIIEGKFKQKWLILKKCKIFWPVIFFVLVMFISTLINPPYNQGIYPKFYINGFDVIFRHYFLGFVLIFIAITDLNKSTIKNMLYAFIAAMLISEIFSYLMLFKIIKRTHNDSTPFLSHSFYTAYLAFTIILLIDNFFKSGRIYLKIFDLLFTITATTNLFVNGGRIGQITFIFLIIFYLFYKFGKNIKIILTGILILPILYVLAYNFSPVFKNRMNITLNTVELVKNENGYFHHTSFGQRVLIWNICLSDFKYDFSIKKLLLGNGFGKSRKEFDTIRDKYFSKDKFIYYLNHPHNMYVYLLFTGGFGLLGMFLYILFLFFKLNFFEYDIYAKIFALTIIFLSFTEDSLMRSYNILFFVTFTGMFYAYRRIKLISTYYETSNIHRDSV